ncbi:MAG: hypothetical protein ACK57N_12050 [Planctomycetia bacterium]
MLRSALSTLFLATLASAQSNYDFAILGSQSNFTWTGTSSLGAIVGNPSNQFRLEGGLVVTMGATAGTPDLVGIVGGNALVTPDIRGRINNPLPFLPPVATLEINGLTLSPSAPPVAVAPGGAFAGSLTLTATSGTLTVSPLGGTPTTTSMVGATSTPQSTSGTLVRNGVLLQLALPINTTFPFSDPTTATTGTFTVVGTMRAEYSLSKAYCFGDGTSGACPCGNQSTTASASGCLNSTLAGGRLVGAGLASTAADSLSLSVSNLPATTTVLLFQGTTATAAAFGDGLRCAAGTILRLGTRTTSAGAASWPGTGGAPNLSAIGAIPTAGGVRTYQAWYRNSASFCTPSVFNLTNGLQVTWLP